MLLLKIATLISPTDYKNSSAEQQWLFPTVASSVWERRILFCYRLAVPTSNF